MDDLGVEQKVGRFPEAATPTSRLRQAARRLSNAPVLHTMLFAAYPVVFLWAQNLKDDPSPRLALLLILEMVAGAMLIIAIAYAILRDLRRACFVATAFVGAFAAFGRVAREMNIAALGSDETWLLIGWLMATLGLAVVAGLIRKRAGGLTRILNLIAAALVAINVVPIMAHASGATEGTSAAWPLDASSLDPSAAGPARDVYYLIFDRYAGERTLRDLYDFDNAPFLEGLRDRGFVVVDGALANYPQTTHSLASSLNLTYLDDLAADVGPTSGDWGPLRDSLRASTLSRTLQSLGYRYVHLGSWWTPTTIDPTADVEYSYGGEREFSGVYWATTMWPALAGRLGIGASPDQWVQQWERVPFQVEKVLGTAEDPRLTFTFAHFTLPHTPYVFHADGSMAENAYRPAVVAYVDQLRFTNTVIARIADGLLSQPGPLPIIVIQSDEGPHPPEYDYAGNITWPWAEQSDEELGRKLRILEAVYLPDLVDRSAYEDVTPVNLFRLILSDYFGADLPRLADRTEVFVDYQHPYRFVDVTRRVR